MPKEMGTYTPKPWYKRSGFWAWVVTGVCILLVVIIMAIDEAAEKKAKTNQSRPSSYEYKIRSITTQSHGLKSSDFFGA